MTNNPHIENLIVATETRGRGVDGDPVREVVCYFTAGGKRLAEKDEWMEQRLGVIVIEHLSRGEEIALFQKRLEVSRVEIQQANARIRHLEQCIANYRARDKKGKLRKP